MALSGMTGFARVEGAQGPWSWAVEARSVNGRSLEIRFRGPPGFDALERGVREGAQKRFARGQVSLTLSARRAEASGGVRVDEAAVTALLAAAAPFLATGMVRKPSWDGLLALRGVLTSREAEEAAPDARPELQTAMASSVLEALASLDQARHDEGAALLPVLAGLVDRIEALTDGAEEQAAAQGPALRERLRARFAELLRGAGISEERLVAEAAVIAARADVREELDRLKAHVGAARTLMASDGAVGRKLDFLTQEFMREANTLCSKSASIPLTQTGLELKAAVDQLREQVQNVE